MFGYQWVIWHCSALHIDDIIVFVLILSHGKLFCFFSATFLKRLIKPSQLPGCVTKQQHSSSWHSQLKIQWKCVLKNFTCHVDVEIKKKCQVSLRLCPEKRNPPLQRTSYVLSLFGINSRTMWLSSAIAVTRAENREKVPPVETLASQWKLKREKTQDIVIHC